MFGKRHASSPALALAFALLALLCFSTRADAAEGGHFWSTDQLRWKTAVGQGAMPNRRGQMRPNAARCGPARPAGAPSAVGAAAKGEGAQRRRTLARFFL